MPSNPHSHTHCSQPGGKMPTSPAPLGYKSSSDSENERAMRIRNFAQLRGSEAKPANASADVPGDGQTLSSMPAYQFKPEHCANSQDRDELHHTYQNPSARTQLLDTCRYNYSFGSEDAVIQGRADAGAKGSNVSSGGDGASSAAPFHIRQCDMLSVPNGSGKTTHFTSAGNCLVSHTSDEIGAVVDEMNRELRAGDGRCKKKEGMLEMGQYQRDE